MKWLWQRLSAVIILGAALAVPLAAHAEVVTNWHSDVTVAKSGVTTITETIVYDPEDGTHHGIIREIPGTFSDGSNKYYTRITPISVTDESGSPYAIDSKQVGRTHLYLRIGDSHETISGPHTYVITYSITPLVQQAGDHDRLIYNVVGNAWVTNIQQMSATIHLPDGEVAGKTACYTGASGATTSNCTATASGSTVSVQTTNLPAYSALTADVQLPTGSVTSYLKPNTPVPLTPTEKIITGVIIGAGIIAALALLVDVLRWWLDYHRRKSITVIPLYETPDGLLPAQLAMIEKADTKQIVTASVIDLAVRGYLKITQLQAKSWLRKGDYRLDKLPKEGTLQPFEQELMNGLFSAGPSVNLSDLKGRTSMSTAIHTMTSDLGDSLKAAGYFAMSPTSLIPKLRWFAVVASILLGIACLATLDSDVSTAEVTGVLAAVAALAALGLSFLKTGRTRQGDSEWAKVEGFKWFLRVTEKDRLAFTDAPAKTPELFSKLLPAAIALGVEKQWAAQFAGIDVAPAVGYWYGGYALASFDPGSFTSDLNSGFGGAVSSSFAGSSGSGFAGGGGGGGGGGGW